MEINMTLSQKSFAEIAVVLKKYEIGGITDELITQLEEDEKQLPEEFVQNRLTTLLTAVGQGDTDYNTWNWVPSENGVYCFDAEVFQISKMYTHFLLGVSALGNGALDFKNIIEDTQGIDRENGSGKRWVRFDWNGMTYTLEAQVNYDWFDVNIINELNKIITAHGNDKQLFLADDGYQVCIIFYRDVLWADEFQRETGLILSK